MVNTLIPTVHHFRLERALDGSDVKYECSSLRNFALIRHDGAVTPCLRFADFEVGNLKEQSWDEIGNSKRYQEAVDEVLNCEGCMNTWCTDWSMEENALPFRAEIAKWANAKIKGTKSMATPD